MGAVEAAEHLRALLERPGRYRNAWTARVMAGTVDQQDVDQAAVCRVLADHLWDSGTRSEHETGLARSLRDRVRRALAGRPLTQTTLGWFTGAFEMTEQDADLLAALLRGSPAVRAVIGADAAPLALPRQTEYRTLSVHDFHWIGAHRRPVRHETIQVIESLVDNLDRYRFRFDTDTLALDVLSGGRPAGPVQAEPSGLFGVDVLLTQPLPYRATTTLRLVSHLGYRLQPPPEFRRMVPTRMDSVDMVVKFDPAALPDSVRLCRWRSLQGPPETIVEMPLGPDHAVHHFFDVIENAIVGFCWTWHADASGPG